MCSKYILPTKVPACWKIMDRKSNADKERTKITIFFYLFHKEFLTVCMETLKISTSHDPEQEVNT
jgi:hypothetical protein